MNRKVRSYQETYGDTGGRRTLDLTAFGVDCLPVLALTTLASVKPGADIHCHHGCVEIQICMRGRLSFEVEGQIFPFLPGMIFVAMPDEPHRMVVKPKGLSIRRFLFKVPPRGKSVLGLPPGESNWLVHRLTHFPVRLFPCTSRVVTAFDRLLSAHDLKDVGGEEKGLRMRSAALELLLAVADAPYAPASPKGRCSAKLSRVVCRMESHPEHDYPVDVLAREMSLSAAAFYEEFKRSTGQSPHAFLVERRVRAAASALADGKLDIRSAAKVYAFSSPQHFASAFRRIMGESPSGYVKERKMKKTMTMLLLLLSLLPWAEVWAAETAAPVSAPAKMMTEWGSRVTPENAWRDYPRPQMVREEWTCLNGLWDYVITSNVDWRAVEVAHGKILVPFCFESALSGVGRVIEPHEKMVYSRKINLQPRKDRRTLLNFEAVDWRAQVFVNGIEATDAPHEGGNLPFSVDITPFVREGENELKVIVWDPTHTFINAGGKQNEKTHGCFYTRVSGIWQTVWLEEVPKFHIRSYRVMTDVDCGRVDFEFDKVEGAGEVSVTTDLPRDFVCWTPDTPQLYHFTARYGEDVVRGYFAMRKVDKAKDARGNWRFRLNNEFVFPIGTLDQGWWPDGLLTPPSAAACVHDIETLKRCGFNMMRKHIKVEPRIYYHLCDKLGLMVFQDAPSPAGWVNIFDETKSLQRYGMFRREWKAQVDHLVNAPSIVMWIPYNEAWGQPDADYTRDTLRWTRRYDPSRLVGGPSGWNDFDGGDGIDGKSVKVLRKAYPVESPTPAADTVDCHCYPGPDQIGCHRNRISILGEFGGLGLRIPGHVWDEKKSWGYAGTGGVVDSAETQRHYLKLMDGVASLTKQGLAACVYTQTSDVEVEINGLMTYDRKVLKFDPNILSQKHAEVKQSAALATDPAH